MAKGIKTGGRTIGTPNRVTSDLRTSINDFLGDNIDTLQENFDKLEPKDKIYFIEKLLKYSIPRMNDNSFTLDSNMNRGFYFELEKD
jgi:hypothetical protein